MQPASISDPAARSFYQEVLELLIGSGFPFLIGGAYALQFYTGIARDTKDLDLLVRVSDVDKVLALLDAHGWRTEIREPLWLGKVFFGDHFVDVIFGFGNGIAYVDDSWFEGTMEGSALGLPVRFCSPEDAIWSRAFVMERERYDGADVAHLLRALSARLNWRRLLDRFADDWRVLLSFLVLFGFIYPAERDRIPPEVLKELVNRLLAETAQEPSRDPVCGGTLLSRAQFKPDVEDWGMLDARSRRVGQV